MYFVHCQEADPRQSRSVPDTEAGRQAGWHRGCEKECFNLVGGKGLVDFYYGLNISPGYVLLCIDLAPFNVAGVGSYKITQGPMRMVRTMAD